MKRVIVAVHSRASDCWDERGHVAMLVRVTKFMKLEFYYYNIIFCLCERTISCSIIQVALHATSSSGFK